MKATIADQDRVTRRHARYAEIPVRDVLGSMRPHTYGVRPLPCPSVATEPRRCHQTPQTYGLHARVQVCP